MLRHGLMIATAALALAACNNHSADQAADNSSAMADNGAMAADSAMSVADPAMTDAAMAPAAATAPEFVRKMAISDMYEIESSRLAQSRSGSPEIKAFAKQMIADHSATTAEVKAIGAKDAALKPPAAMDDRHRTLIADLTAATSETFDAVYADQQARGHEEAHALLTGYAAGGENADLKAFAAKTAPKVQGHLDMIRKMDMAGAEASAPRP